MRGTLPKHQIQSHEEKGMKKKKILSQAMHNRWCKFRITSISRKLCAF